MSDTKIKTSNIGNLAVTHALLHTDMDLTSKTVQVAAPSSDTHPATKLYVDTEVANLIDSAPGTLDTLNELAAAVNDDANFNATIATQLGTKLPLAGGTLTGNLTLTSTASGSSASPELELRRDITGADANYLGQIKFTADNDADQNIVFAKITGKILDASDGTEDGIIEFAHKKAGSNNISARFRSDSLELINGTNLTVDGTTELTGTLGIGVAPSSAIGVYSTKSLANGLAAQLTNTESSTGSGLVVKGGNNSSTYSADFRDYNNTTLMRIRGDGNVGIGITSPDAKLNIAHSSDNLLTIQNNTYQGSSQNTESAIRFKSSGGTDDERAKGGILFKNDGSAYGRGDLHFLVDSNDDNGNAVLADSKMVINHEGNVGIGTTSMEAAAAAIKVEVESGSNYRPMRLRFVDDNNGATNNPLAFEYKAGLEIENGYSGAAPSANGTKIAKLSLTTVTSSGYGATGSIFVTTNAGTGHNSGELAFAVGNNSSGLETEAMRINKDGKVGIGTTTPGSKLTVVSGASRLNGGSVKIGKQNITGGLFLHSDASTSSHYNWMITTQDTVNQGFEIIPSSAPGNIEFSNPAFVITGDDRNVGIGTSGPADKLDIQGADNGLTIRSVSANRPIMKLINGSSTMLTLSANGSYAAIGGPGGLNDYMLFHPNSGNRVIASGGAINLHNANTAGWALNGNGNLGQANFSTDNNRPLILHRYNGAGQIAEFGYSQSTVGSIDVSASGTTYNTTSDRRLKDNIQPISDATDKLMDMKPVTHTWIDNPDDPQVHGFIAQEMQEIIPEAVSGDAESDEMMSMDYGRITPVIVAALQDALNEIKELKTRIDELENK